MGKTDLGGTTLLDEGMIKLEDTCQKLGKLRIYHLCVFLLFILYVGLQVSVPSPSAQSKAIFSSIFTYTGLVSTPTPPTHECVSTVPSISEQEFASRQHELAQILNELDAVAYIAEPGAQTMFFGNFSSKDWKLSERPLFLVVTPRQTGSQTEAQISVLTPKFEATRARLLQVPFVEQYFEWPEEENPYVLAAEGLGLLSGESSLEGKKLLIDNSARHFHYDGFTKALEGTGLIVTSAPEQINQLRERKSDAEIGIMKCANEATLIAIRHVHKQMYIGMRESEARDMMSATLSQMGLSQGGCLTLFGENAALPHGSGTDRVLGERDFALFDCTATLHGYWSDITRTVALPSSKISTEHLRIWRAVAKAQETAGLLALAGVEASHVDHMARVILKTQGSLDHYFTHRLGHGIGLEGHEHPYINGGNDATLQPGHSFSNEPGVYIEGQVGVRLEDCMYIDHLGLSYYLTAGVGGRAVTPWDP